MSLEFLRAHFAEATITSAVQCAGNRRNHMNAARPVRGGSWDVGAISTATWTGVRLRDVLVFAGVERLMEGLDVSSAGARRIRHVWLEGHDHDSDRSYLVSIPIEKALSETGDVLLAYKMNGETLPIDHGFPLRVVVPGVAGARQVKWLKRIVLSEVESPGFWQQSDYKSFSPSVDWASADYSKARSIQELPVQSAIVEPRAGAVLDTGATSVTLKGYAFSGGGRAISRVDVSIDGGTTWTVAHLDETAPAQPPGRAWAWRLWSATIPLTDTSLQHCALDEQSGRRVLEACCKATDESYNTQPETAESIWNIRGLLMHAWHRIPIYLSAPPKS